MSRKYSPVEAKYDDKQDLVRAQMETGQSVAGVRSSLYSGHTGLKEV